MRQLYIKCYAFISRGIKEGFEHLKWIFGVEVDTTSLQRIANDDIGRKIRLDNSILNIQLVEIERLL